LNVLVTGGAGYLGSILVPLLLKEGYSVTVLDNFLYQQTSLFDCCHNTSLTIVNGDVRDQRLMDEVVPKADVLLPLACLTGAPICARDPSGAQAINFDAVRHMAELKSRDQLMVFPSTNSGYGIGQDNIYCDENTPLRPVSLYGRLKVEIESMLLDRGDAVTFRFATLFGVSPRMRLDLLVNDFVHRAVSDGSIVLFEPHFKRNYLHVRDGARAFLHAIANYDNLIGRAFNVGLSDANLSKSELCDMIRRHVPNLCVLTADLREDPDKRNYVVSNSRIEATGFRTEFGLDAGIAELIKGYNVIRRRAYSNV
jgi:nucleoside-diphosphate-sugar epimerase